jgi:hypothetical protein
MIVGARYLLLELDEVARCLHCPGKLSPRQCGRRSSPLRHRALRRLLRKGFDRHLLGVHRPVVRPTITALQKRT